MRNRRTAAAVFGFVMVSLAASARAQVSFSRTFIRNVPADTSLAGPQTIALADLTGDMRADIIVVDNEADQIAVYLNNGSGGFPGSPTYTFGTGPAPVAVVTADFNNDGFLDAATANDIEDEITVQLGDGTGNFTDPRDFPVDPGPVGLVATDLNNDLIPDLAVLSVDTVHLLKSNGDGTFSNFTPASVRTLCSDGVAIAAGLFDSNTNQDLAIACNANSQVSVLLGNGDGTFSAAMLNNAGDGPGALVVSELIQPNLRDIAVVQVDNFGDENVSLLLGNGDGTFDFSTTTAGVDSTAIASADLNLDGRRDLAVSNTGESFQIAILLNTPNEGDGGFTLLPAVPGTSLGVDARGLAIQSGSINGDGLPDLIALAEDEEGSTLIGVLINTSNQTPAPTPSPSPTRTPATPSPSPTSPFQQVEFRIGSAVGQPGQSVDITVSLNAAGVAVAATANDIFVAPTFAVDPSTCRINSALPNTIAANFIDGDGPFAFGILRVFVLATATANPIPNGPLYTCTFQIHQSTFPGFYFLDSGATSAFSPDGSSTVFSFGAVGSITVSLFPGPEPSPPPPGPSGGDGDGCSVADSAQRGSAGTWLVAVGALALTLRRWRRLR